MVEKNSNKYKRQRNRSEDLEKDMDGKMKDIVTNKREKNKKSLKG